MTKEKRAYFIKTIIRSLKKSGVSLPQIQEELDFREARQIVDGRDGSDADLLNYSTEDLDGAETFWDVEEGRWKGAGFGDYRCSNCDEEVSGTPEFCPHCHAYMG